LLIQGIARVVVPFFFLTSAFLFFSRMQPDILKGAQSARSLWRYVERIGIMYFFWTLLINGLLALGYFIHGVRAGIFQLTRNFFLSAAYPFLITSN
jgi:surface polysaccharide O-acyltransferase-like enzyme